MPQHARGTFDVTMQPLPVEGRHGLARMSIDKHLQGELEANSKGEMVTAGDPRAGEAGYVAMERVTGTLHGRSGSFVLQHSATMSGGGQKLEVIVTPGSGTEGLEGLAGTFTITVTAGKHFYDFEYSLPTAK